MRLPATVRSGAPLRRVADILQHAPATAPAAIALREGEVQWTYTTLLDATRQAATLLEDCGVVRGDRVMVVADNGLGQVAAFFGAGLLGAWPVLFNARGIAREIDAVRAHATPRVMVYGSGNSTDAVAHAERHRARLHVTLADTPLATLAVSATDEASEPDATEARDEVGALIYTSGTTAAPKGVMATHAGLLNFADRSVEVRRLQSSDVVLGALPISHIFGVATILLSTLRAGGCVWLQPRFDPACTARAMRDGTLTVVHGVPTLYTRLLAHLEADARARRFPRLRYAYAGGGALDPALKRRIEAALGLPLHHGYGMTEYAGSMFVTHIDRPRTDALPGELAPDCTVRFVDLDGKDVGVGEPGEIWVRGPGTMLGYYREPELTRDTITAEGWLRTGDLGYLMPDGALRIVSRARDIIKRSGFTVYPLEVEQQLAEHPEVSQVGVVGIRTVSGDEEIVAFVEARCPEAIISPGALMSFARERLASYKCPQHVVQVRELPLTANGKVRKQDLRDLWRTLQ